MYRTDGRNEKNHRNARDYGDGGGGCNHDVSFWVACLSYTLSPSNPAPPTAERPASQKLVGKSRVTWMIFDNMIAGIAGNVTRGGKQLICKSPIFA